MQIFDIMTRDVIILHENDSLKTATEKMASAHIHHLVVTACDGTLTGIVSDRDIHVATQSPFAAEVGNQEDLLAKITVSQIMTQRPYCIEPQFSVHDAVSLMLEKRINALPVVHDQCVVGIVTSTDLLRVLANEPAV